MCKSTEPIIFDGTIGSKVDTKEMKHQKSVKCLGCMCVKWMTRQRSCQWSFMRHLKSKFNEKMTSLTRTEELVALSLI